MNTANEGDAGNRGSNPFSEILSIRHAEMLQHRNKLIESLMRNYGLTETEATTEFEAWINHSETASDQE